MSDEKRQLDEFKKFFDSNFIVLESGKIRDKSKNRYYTLEDVQLKFESAMRLVGKEETEYLSRPEVKECVDAIIAAALPPITEKVDLRQYLKSILQDTDRFLINRSYTEIRSIKPGSGTPMNSDITDLKHYLMAKRTEDPELKKFDKGDIDDMLMDIAREAKDNSAADLVNELKFDPSCVPFIDTYLHKIHEYFQIEESYEIFKVMMCHWAWQVKRRMKMKKVVWHIWLNFFGPTGTGKSWFINKLASRFEEFYTEGAKISTLFSETKEIKKMTEKYIIYFDELAVNSDNANAGVEDVSTDDIKTLKSILTSDKLDTRIYGTQDQMKRTITFSCISSANDHLYDVIFDPESMRRYFEFNCKRTKVGTEEETTSLNEILDRSVEFWKGIDDSRECGYWDPNDGGIGSSVWDIQKCYYPTKSSLIQMSHFFKFKYNDKISTMETHKSYSSWCKEYGFKAKSIMNFAAEIRKRWPKLVDSKGMPHILFTDDTENEDRYEFFNNLSNENTNIDDIQ